jgi:hypothetical protein
MHFCKAVIALGEDRNNTVHRTEYSPISWPEVEVIRAMHGDSAVVEIIPFVSVPQTAKAERQRLAEIYGPEVCAHIWGGRSGPSEMEAPDATLKAGVTWINPITFETEVTEGKGHGLEPDVLPPADPDEADTTPFGDTKIAVKKR